MKSQSLGWRFSLISCNASLNSIAPAAEKIYTAVLKLTRETLEQRFCFTHYFVPEDNTEVGSSHSLL